MLNSVIFLCLSLRFHGADCTFSSAFRSLTKRIAIADNGVLRAFGNAAHRGVVPQWASMYAGMSVVGKFTSTIHAINSGILKLSRLQVSEIHDRGLA